LLVTINIPVAVLLLAKTQPKLNQSIMSRKRFRFFSTMVLVFQLNCFLASQYLRKVKKYPFEGELATRYFSELKEFSSETSKSN
jgi:hypothetical protein